MEDDLILGLKGYRAEQSLYRNDIEELSEALLVCTR